MSTVVLSLIFLSFVYADPLPQCDNSACLAYQWAVPLWKTGNARFQQSTNTASFAMNRIGRRVFATPQHPTPLDSTCNAVLCNGTVWYPFNPSPVVSPNQDTIYGAAWGDVGIQNYVLTIGSPAGRYYSVDVVDMYTNTIGSLDTQSFPTGGKFCFTTSSCSSAVTYTKVFSSHRYFFLAIRVYSSGATTACGADGCGFLDTITFTPEVAPVQPGVLNPLVKYAHFMQQGLPSTCSYTYNQEPCGVHGNKSAFWDAVCSLLAENPLDPESSEGSYVDSNFAKLGIHSNGCSALDYAQLDPTLNANTADGGYTVTKAVSSVYGLRFGQSWLELIYSGQWGQDFIGRAVTATRLFFMKSNDKAEYYTAFYDSKKGVLTGSNTYKIEFKGASAQVDLTHGGFWSITVYDSTYYMNQLTAHNSLRNNTANLPAVVHLAAVCSTNPFCLPVPAGQFNVMLRRYVPSTSDDEESFEPRKIDLCDASAPCN